MEVTFVLFEIRKFKYYGKATKFEKICHIFWNYLVTSKQSGIFCGILKMSELYQIGSCALAIAL